MFLCYKNITKIFKNSWKKFSEMVQDKGLNDKVLKIINKYLKTNYKSLDDIDKLRITEGIINEDFAHYWDLLKQEAFPTLAFWPALKVWLEMDKLFTANGAADVNVKMVIVYAIFWILLVSGKYVKSWADWKKKNPEEYEKEKTAKV